MWVISGFIATATVAVLAGPGLAGVPGHWLGLSIACLFSAIAFGLGFYE
jgi:hypothetical protein